MTELIITDWQLVRLTLDRIGPFQQGVQTFNFFGVDLEEDTEFGAGPANLYMLLAKNGYGKTTVLEAIYGLFALLNDKPDGRFYSGQYQGVAQLDVRATWIIDGRSRDVLLSIWYGADAPLCDWSSEDILGIANAREWAKLNLKLLGSNTTFGMATDQLGRLFMEMIESKLGEAPTELYGLSQSVPTVLYFPADRRVSAPVDKRAVSRPSSWGYQPALIFSSDGPEWGDSIDNLLVWLEWLAVRRSDRAEDKRVDDLLEYINKLIFKDDPGKRILAPHREELRTYVETRHGLHPLSSLSHGERALLQILTRTLTHMTANTIVLIDEIEVHLHSRWMNRMFEAMKDMLRRYKALTLIFTTHNRELITVFRHDEAEDELVKGGHLIESELD